MGDPSRQRKKYSAPSHPWQKEKIVEEKGLIEEYGIKNKREIWKMESMLKKFAKQAKKLVTLSTMQAEIEKKQMLEKMKVFGLLKENAGFDDVLGITLKDIMERRLQTIVFRKNLSRTIKQARQFVVHKHIAIRDKVITSPSYIVKTTEEPLIDFLLTSSFSNVDHPEREIKLKVEEEKAEEKIERKKTRKVRGMRRVRKGEIKKMVKRKVIKK